MSQYVAIDNQQLEELRAIRKALEANSNPTQTDIAQLTGGGALARQFLDGVLVSIVQSDPDFMFLKQLPTRSVDETLVEYTKYRSHGASRHHRSSFVAQSDNPKVADAVLKRMYDEMAYLSEGGIYNRTSQLVKSIQSPEIVQTESSTMRLLTSLATTVWYGDKSINGLEFNGFGAQIRNAGSSLIHDCRGALPETAVVSGYAAQIRSRRFGVANQFWMAPGTRNLVNNTYQSSGNTMVWQNGNQNPKEIFLGNQAKGYVASEALNGEVSIMSDLWLDRSTMDVSALPDPNGGPDIEAVSGPNAPDTPSFALAANPATPGSLFDAPYSGVTKFRVAAMLKGDESIAAPAVSVNIPVGGSVGITITPAVAGLQADSFRIYRETAPGSGEMRWMADVKRAATPTTVYTDLNFDLPGTSIGVMGDFNSRSVSDVTRTMVLSELLPLLKTVYPFGVGGTTVKEQLLSLDYFCVLQIFAPEKFILFKNLPVNAS